ncbi:hypothetical protein IFM89_034178 [Coptis chinensis]|uniref:Uncharacterized protein n=1 Tax=Coptis chinensis TaxID=261450 RepID=A0A835IK53_9MAGN|nr:hypothetical protein IFM89_034178 [Coptis chinensis]
MMKSLFFKLFPLFLSTLLHSFHIQGKPEFLSRQWSYFWDVLRNLKTCPLASLQAGSNLKASVLCSGQQLRLNVNLSTPSLRNIVYEYCEPPNITNLTLSSVGIRNMARLELKSGVIERDPTELYDGYKWFMKHILYYKGGRVQYFYNIDPDKMSYFELKGMIEIVNDDKDIIEMMKMAKNERVAVYVEHEQGDDVEESEDDKEVDVGDCLEESESESESETASEAATLDHISEDDDELIEVRKRNIEIKYKKKKSGTEEVDQVPDEPHEEASEATIEQTSDVANELPNEMDTGGVGEDTGGAGDDESDYAASDDYLSPESSEEEDEDVASVKERKRNLKVKKRMHPIFNPNVEMSNIQIELGMRFEMLLEDLKLCVLVMGVAGFYMQVTCKVKTGASKRKTGVKGRNDHVPEGVGVFTADSGNSYLKMSATGTPILINEAKIFEANNKRKGRPPLPRRSSKAPVSTTASKQSLTTASATASKQSSTNRCGGIKRQSLKLDLRCLETQHQETHHQAVASRNSQSLTTDAVASSSKPKTRSVVALETQHQETHHQAVAARNSQSLTTDAVASSSKPRNSPSKTKRKNLL